MQQLINLVTEWVKKVLMAAVRDAENRFQLQCAR